MRSHAPPLLCTHGLTKRYGDLTVVEDLALEVPEGSLFGVLGPNGSGKTTTIRMVLGLVFASEGSIELFGASMPGAANRVLRDVGVLIEGPGFYPYMSGPRNLAMIDASGPRPRGRSSRRRIGDVLELVGLDRVGKRPVKAYSMGMRQRLGIAAALLRRPRLLILDEPTNGLDPNGIHELRQLFVRLVDDGTTVFLSSHQLNEVEMICSHVAMMSSGRLVAQDEVERLTAPTGRVRVETPDPHASDVIERLDGALIVESIHLGDGRWGFDVDLPGRRRDELNGALVAAGIRVDALVPERHTLESVFLSLTDADALR